MSAAVIYRRVAAQSVAIDTQFVWNGWATRHQEASSVGVGGPYGSSCPQSCVPWSSGLSASRRAVVFRFVRFTPCCGLPVCPLHAVLWSSSLSASRRAVVFQFVRFTPCCWSSGLSASRRAVVFQFVRFDAVLWSSGLSASRRAVVFRFACFMPCCALSIMFQIFFFLPRLLPPSVE